MCSTLTLFRHIFVVIVLLPTVTAAGEDEFAVNVFTDLAPLLALFGEQFARQFISESLTWLDHIIFAMVPLGIITAIVGAIRVSGPPWARAFIGRARETRAVAELELLSSTSREVCEVFNGRGVVRTLGTPKLTQLIIFPRQYLHDHSTCGIHTLESAYESEPKMLDKGVFGLRSRWVSDRLRREEGKKVAENSVHGFKKESRLTTKRSLGRTKNSAHLDPELGNEPEDLVIEETTNHGTVEGEAESKKSASNALEFPAELKGAGPNLQLNLPMSYHFHNQSIGKLWWAATIAVVIQLAVIIISTITTFHGPTRKTVGESHAAYWFWLFIGGTALLNLGMMLCSWVIEKRTKEYVWRRNAIGTSKVERTKDNRPAEKILSNTNDGNASSKKDARPTNSTSTVPNTDAMLSVSIAPLSNLETGHKITTPSSPADQKGLSATPSLHSLSRRSSLSEDDAQSESSDPDDETKMQLFWLQQKHTVSDQRFEAFLILGGEKTEILTSSIPPSSEKEQLPVWMKRTLPAWMMKMLLLLTEKVPPAFLKSIDTDRFEFLAVVAALFGVAGFILQFEGMRGLAWPTAVAQLVAILLMALVRAVVRRRLGTDMSTISAKAGHELDWLALRLVYEDKPLKPPRKLTESEARPLVRQWRVYTYDILNPESPPSNDTPTHGTGFAAGEPGKNALEQPQRLLARKGELVKFKVSDGGSLAKNIVDSTPKVSSPRIFPPTSEMLLKVRRRVGELTECPGIASREAIALSQAISLTLTELCPLGKDETGTFKWSFDAIMNMVPSKDEETGESEGSRLASNQRVNTDTSGNSMKVPKPQNLPESKLDPIVLEAKCDEHGWKISPPVLDAILSLWMSAESFRDHTTENKSETGGEPSDWLTKLASVTVKYRRILGENPPHYTTAGNRPNGTTSIRTDILTRDLNWWTRDSRISSISGDHRAGENLIEQSMALSSTGKVKVVIGFNGLDTTALPEKAGTLFPVETRKDEKRGHETMKTETVTNELATHITKPDDEKIGEVVSMISSGPLASILANHLFSCFMWALSGEIDPEKIDKVTVEDSELFDHADFNNTWNLPTLRSKRLMKLARDIEGFGLGRAEDVLLAIIPPLSYKGILPTEAMMSVLTKKAKEHEKYHEWAHVENAYTNLLKLDLYPQRMDRISYEVVVELIEFLLLAKEGVDDSHTPGGVPEKIIEGQSRALQEAVRNISKELRAHGLLLDAVRGLQWFFEKQNRTQGFAKLLDSLDASIAQPSRARLNKSDQSTEAVRHKELLKIAKFDSYHEFSSTKATKEEKQGSGGAKVANLQAKPDIFGWYPLHYATVLDDDDVFKVVLEDSKKKRINHHVLTNRSGRRPLHYAAMFRPTDPKNLMRLKRLTPHRQIAISVAKVEGRNGMIPIHCAARYGTWESFEELSKYSDSFKVDAFGRSALHLGVIAGNSSVADFLLRKGNNAIVRSGEELLQRTALHFALIFDRVDIAKTILKSETHLKAITIDDDQKQTPVHLIISRPDYLQFFTDILVDFPNAAWMDSTDDRPTLAAECLKSTLAVLLGVKNDGLLERHEQLITCLFDHVIKNGWGIKWIYEAFSVALSQKQLHMLPVLLRIVKSLSNEDTDRVILDTDDEGTNGSGDRDFPVSVLDKDRSGTPESIQGRNPDGTNHASRSNIFSDVQQYLKDSLIVKGLPVLIEAIRTGNDLVYKDLMQQTRSGDLDWNEKDSENRSPLAYIAKIKPASDSSDPEKEVLGPKKRDLMLELLWTGWNDKKKKEVLNARQGRHDKTPLMYAAKNGLTTLVRTFVENGADIRATDKLNRTAFGFALEHTEATGKDIWDILVRAAPDIVNKQIGSYEAPPLVNAIEDQRQDIIRYLAQPEWKTDPNMTDKDGDTPLAWCVYQWAITMIDAMFEHFPETNLHLRNNDGSSPFLIACRQYLNGRPDYFVRFLRPVSRICTQEYEVTLVLSHAIFKDDADLVALLLEAGADPRITDDSGRSLLFIAALHGSLAMFENIWKTSEKIDKKETKVRLMLVHYACAHRNDQVSEQIVAKLNKASINPSPFDTNGWTIREYSESVNNKQKTAVRATNPSASLQRSEIRYREPFSWAVGHAETRDNGNNGGHPFFIRKAARLELKNPYPELSSDRDSSRVIVRADHCIPPDWDFYYWELEILNHPQTDDEDRILAIGICAENFNPNSFPGWPNSGAYGYHSDDGGVFTGKGRPSFKISPYGPDDTVGCFVDVRDPLHRKVQFAFNGVLTGYEIELGEYVRGPLYPCVGLSADRTDVGAVVEARFNVRKVSYDPVSRSTKRIIGPPTQQVSRLEEQREG